MVSAIQGSTATALKQQTKLEGADRAISQRESKLTQSTTTQPETSGGNSVAKATQTAPTKTEGVRTGAENNLQQQAESLTNSAANAAQQGKPAQGEVGQNINEFA